MQPCFQRFTTPIAGFAMQFHLTRWWVVKLLRSWPHEVKADNAGGIAQLARAVALQAIGQGFESPYLHRFCLG